MRLDLFDNHDFQRGRPRLVEALWILVSALTVASFLPGSHVRIMVLRLFGARIGVGVVLKPSITVKFPWNLEIGDHVWIGEKVWIDNLAKVRIGSHSCVSQGAYLCTGSHDWTREGFDLITRDITLEEQCWVGAMARVAPGTNMVQGSVLAMGSVASGTLEAWTIYQGIPACRSKARPRSPESRGSTERSSRRP